MKRILDSVHGYIYVDDAYCDKLIDTEYFQRLRRIEQTSARAVFPSARHDRFIHSLGVYHLGCRLVESLTKTLPQTARELIPANVQSIFESYKIACLLHDIAHSPYFHTFEKYFDNEWSDLKGALVRIIGEASFEEDWNAGADPSAHHERMSAIVATGVPLFCDFIAEKGASKDLVAIMIIGLKYRDESHHSFENAMIDLIHGDVIDADGLDYVCRDAWASGYCTTNVDVDRLIDSVRIVPDEHNIFQLCYTAKCLNEIEAVLKVKTFQQSYVINHHTVTYEQALLVKAMESAAVYHFNGDRNVEDEDIRTTALQKLCSIDCFYKPENQMVGKETDHTHINIALPMDDDFVSLMKPIRDDKYVNQWLSRNYLLAPLWKSKAEFYQVFDHLRHARLTSNSWIFSDDCKNYIAEQFGIDPHDVWIKRATPKYKENFAKKVKLYVNDKVVGYEDLFPDDIHSYEPSINEFFYVYIPKDANKQAVVDALKRESSRYMMERG